jgi:transcriptional regulator
VKNWRTLTSFFSEDCSRRGVHNISNAMERLIVTAPDPTKDVYTSGKGSASFLCTDAEHILGIIHRHPLATIITTDAAGTPHAVLVPLHFDRTNGVFLGHMSKDNAHWQRCVNKPEVLALFIGSRAYISPSWYPEKKANAGRVVPTYNYEAVHVRGRFELVDSLATQATATSANAAAVVEALTVQSEAKMTHPWHVQDAPAGYRQALMRDIVCFRIVPSRIVGSVKESQNKPPATQRSVAEGLTRHGNNEAATAVGGRRPASHL